MNSSDITFEGRMLQMFSLLPYARYLYIQCLFSATGKNKAFRHWYLAFLPAISYVGFELYVQRFLKYLKSSILSVTWTIREGFGEGQMWAKCGQSTWCKTKHLLWYLIWQIPGSNTAHIWLLSI